MVLFITRENTTSTSDALYGQRLIKLMIEHTYAINIQHAPPSQVESIFDYFVNVYFIHWKLY